MGFRQITELVQSALEQPFACELTGADGIDGFFCLVIEVRVRCGVYKGQDTVELVGFKDLVHNQGIFPADVEQNKSDERHSHNGYIPHPDNVDACHEHQNAEDGHQYQTGGKGRLLQYQQDGDAADDAQLQEEIQPCHF